MPLLEVLPEAVRKAVEQINGKDGEVRLSVGSDLLPDGTFGRQWLIITDDRLLVFEDGAEPKKRHEIALREIESIKSETLVGGGALEVTTKDGTVELLRYTNALSKRFGGVVKAIEGWRKGEEVKEEEEEERKCPKCGLPLEEGTKVCPACTPKSKTVLRLIAYLKPHVRWAVLLSALTVASTVLSLVPPWITRTLMDEVLAPKENVLPLSERLTLLGWLVLALLAVHVGSEFLHAARGWLSAWLGNRLTHDIRCQLFQHLNFLSLRFFDKRQIGTVISRVNQDTGALHQFLVWGVQDLAVNLLMVVGIGVALFLMNWRLAILILIPSPLIAVLTLVFWKHIRVYMHRFWHRWSRLNAVLNESLSGIRVVKAFAQEPREVERFAHSSFQLLTTGVQAERAWATLFPMVSLMTYMGFLLVWFFGGRQVIGGSLTIGTLFAFLYYLTMFYGPLQALSWLVNWLSRSLTAAERVFEVLDTQPEVKEAEDAVPMPQIKGRIEFKDVTFGYDKHRPVLKNISLKIQPGEMIGLVGHSGAGKTTTINLLCRFYDVDEGQVLIDGVDIKKIRLDDLRRQMGIVPQDTFLFDGTIAENIAYAKPGATLEEIMAAAKAANAHDFIVHKPDGYDTKVGERGQSLSAGERQRIAIARAILHDPRILILDEATSQLDIDTEKQVQDALARLTKGRTTVAIAHRLSTLRNANRLVVLKEGKIEETGSHDELMEKQGEFYRLAQKFQEISKVRAIER